MAHGFCRNNAHSQPDPFKKRHIYYGEIPEGVSSSPTDTALESIEKTSLQPDTKAALKEMVQSLGKFEQAQKEGLEHAIKDAERIDELSGDQKEHALQRLKDTWSSKEGTLTIKDREDLLKARYEEAAEAIRDTKSLDRLSEIKKNALGFLTFNGERINTQGQLNPGNEYTVDFTGSDGTINKFVQNKITLADMMTAAGVSEVEVKKKDGTVVDAVLKDGKALNKKTNAYLPILNGDKILVPASVEAPAVTDSRFQEDVAKESQKNAERQREDEKTEAQERNSASVDAEWERYQSALNAARGETAGAISALGRGVRVRIPENFNRADFEANLGKMDRGAELGAAALKLYELKQNHENPGASPAPQAEVPVIMDIITQFGNTRNLSFAETYRYVYGRGDGGPRQAQERYTTYSKHMDVISRAKKLHSESREAGQVDFRTKAREEFNDEEMAIFNRYMASIMGMDVALAENDIAYAAKKAQEASDFLVNSYRLMDSFSQIDLQNQKLVEAQEVTQDPEALEEIAAVDATLESIFGEGPAAPSVERRGAGLKNRSRRRRSSDQMNMQNLDQAMQNQEGYANRNVTQEAALQRMRDKYLKPVYKEGRFVESANQSTLNGLAGELNKLREDAIRYVLPADADLAARFANEAGLGSTGAITSENMGQLSAMDRELIRAGYAFRESGSEALQRAQLEEYEAQQKNEILNGNRFGEGLRADLRKLDETGQFDSSELMEIGTHLEETYLGTFGVFKDKLTTMQAGEVINVEESLGAAYSKPFTLLNRGGKTLTLNLGVRNNVITQDFKFNAGLSGSAEVGDRGRVTGGIGATPGAGAFSIGGEIDLGAYDQVQLGASVGAGVTKAGLTTFAQAYLGRDLDAVLLKKSTEAYQEVKSQIDASLADYIETLEASGASPDQIAEMVDGAAAFYDDIFQREGIENMGKLQLSKVGVTVVVGPNGAIIPVPHFNVGIKGRQTLHYALSSNASEAERAAVAQQMNQLSSEADVQRIYVSGEIEMTEEGLSSIASSNVYFPEVEVGRLANMNEELTPQGLALERSGQDLRLNVADLGLITIYSDPQAKVIAKPDANGYVTLHLESGTPLSIQTVKTEKPANEFGHSKHLEIYVSDNPHRSPEAIKSDSQSMVQFERNSTSSQTAAKVIELRAAHESDQSGAVDENADYFMSNEEWKDLVDAHNAMRDAMGARPERIRELPVKTQEELRALAKEVVASKTVNYVDMTSTPGYHQDIIFAFISAQPERKWSRNEIQFMLQEVLVESRANFPGGPEALTQHMLGWNQEALQRHLVDKGLDGETSASIAEKTMRYYARLVRNGTDLPRTEIQNGAVVRTLIGEEQGQSMTFRKSPASADIALLGAMEMTEEQLVGVVGLTPKEAKAYMNATLESVSPIDFRDVESVMRSDLGLYVLDVAHLLYGAEDARLLSQMLNKPEITAENAIAWGNYANTVLQLRRNGHHEVNGFHLYQNTRMIKGFLERCGNDCETATTEFLVEMPENFDATLVENTEYLKRNQAIRFIGAGVAAGSRRVTREVPLRQPEAEGGGHVGPEAEQSEVETGGVVGNEVDSGQTETGSDTGSGPDTAQESPMG